MSGTKTITGTITGGYTLNANIYGLVSITGGGAILGQAGVYGGAGVAGGAGGVGLAAAGAYTPSVVNSGSILAGAGYHGGAATGSAPAGAGGAGGVGVVLTAGGMIANGGAIAGGVGGVGGVTNQPSFLIDGVGGAGGAGIFLVAGGGVSNTGTIDGANGGAGGSSALAGSRGGGGGVGGVAVSLAASGTVTNSGLIAGGYGGQGGDGVAVGGGGGFGGQGVALLNGGLVVNDGVIKGGSAGAGGAGTVHGTGGQGGNGVFLNNGGTVINGSAAGTTAYISGFVGVMCFAGGVATVTNYGTIVGTGPTGFQFKNSGDRLIVEAGSRIVGQIAGGHGVMELAGAMGSGTVSSLGTASAAFGTYLVDTGASWTITGVNTLANQVVEIDGSLTNTGVINDKSAFTLVGSGSFTNGGAKAPAATISGVTGLAAAAGSAVTVTNFGSIVGTGGTAVAFSSAADRLVLEGGSKLVGAVAGGGGALELGAGAGAGTISGLGGAILGFGAYVIDAGASWTTSGTNTLGAASLDVSGSLFNTGVLTGGVGAYAGAGSSATVTNFGTIVGTGGTAVAFGSSSDRLVVEAGSVWTGVVKGGGGALELANGVGTITGLGGVGTVSGAEAMTFSGFGAYALDAGGAWTLTGGNSLATGDVLTLGGVLSVAGALTISGTVTSTGTLAGQAGSTITLANADLIGGVLQSVTTVQVKGAGSILDGTSGAVANQATINIANKTSLTIEGVIANSGKLLVGGKKGTAFLVVGAAGATLSGGGSVVIGGDALNTVTGVTAGATLTNGGNRLMGSGRIGGGSMVLVNQAGGVIDQTGAVGMTIDTGASTVTNAGVIQATGAGGLTIVSSVNNTGLLEALKGGLTVAGVVTGAGSAVINAATLTFGSTFSENVKFTGTTGSLVLASAQTYGGSVQGFSKTGGTSLDLRDIGFVGAGEATFSGTKAGGVLTVTDGTHTAAIAITGNYLGLVWTASDDLHGGTQVVAKAAPGQTHALVAAMAALAPASADGAAISVPVTGVNPPSWLARPGR